MKKHVIVPLLLIACLPTSLFADPIKIANSPVQLTLTPISQKTLRLDILPLDDQGKPKPTPASTILTDAGKVQKDSHTFRDTSELATTQALTVGGTKIEFKSNPLTISFFKPDGKLLQEITVKDADGSLVFHTEAPTFGLGEGRQQFDRRGFYYNFQNGQNSFLATHGTTIPVPFLIGSDNNGGGWGMFIHNPPPPPDASLPPPQAARESNRAWGQFDLRGEDAGPPPPNPNQANYNQLLTPPDVRPTRGRFIPRQDTLNQAPTSIFIMNLDKPADALTEYTALVGHPVMPPKWIMGYQQSHRSLAGPDEVLAVAKKFRDDQLPCDTLIYLGTGYTIATRPDMPNGGWNLGHGSLEFNKLLFPQDMIAKLHDLHYTIVLHKNAAPALLHGNSVNDSPDNPNHIAAYWNTHTSLVKLGVDAWWPDDGDELPVENRLARIRAYYEGPLKDLRNERPWSLNRNGYAGVAKYGGWNWSGDTQSRWATLAAHVPVGIQFSLSCSPWWGTDVGGFSGTPEYSGELFTRWFQFGVFNPLFRSHGRNWHLHTPWGWNIGDPGPRESTLPDAATLEAELHNAAVEPACKKALELRYQLLPYNYTITREACDTGMPLMRALLLNYPNDPTAVSLGDEYLWGPNILVAPVIEKGATERKVYLPEGTWYSHVTSEMLPGKQWVTQKVSLDTIPYYTRAGSITPMDPVRQYTAEKVTEPTTLLVCPGANGEFTLYDDDGHTQAYLTGTDPQTQWIKISWNDAAKKLTLDPDPRMKSWPANFTRLFKIQFQTGNAPSKTIDFKGQHAEVSL